MSVNDQARATAIRLALKDELYKPSGLRSRHLLNLLTVYEPFTYAEIVEILLQAPAPEALLALLDRIASLLRSSETLTGVDMSEAAMVPRPDLVVGPPWAQMRYWCDGAFFELAVRVKHLLLRDVALYTPLARRDAFRALSMLDHEALFTRIVQSYALNPDLLLLYYWECYEEPDSFYRVFVEQVNTDGDIKLRYLKHGPVARIEVLEALQSNVTLLGGENDEPKV